MIRLASHNEAVPAPVSPFRRALLAKVHMAPKALGMDDSDYRALLVRVADRSSAKLCSDRQLEDVLREFERMGFRATRSARPAAPRASYPVANKARAIWISLHQLGAINDPSETALETFGRRQLGVDRLQWADHSEGFRLIEALKAMAVREGWAQDVPARTAPADAVRLLKQRLVVAIGVKIAAIGATPAVAPDIDMSSWSNAKLERAAAELAIQLRDAKGGAR